MSEEILVIALKFVVERLNSTGDCWGWAGEEIAHVALRRWNSYSRRHPKTKRVAEEHRVHDLAKGLQAHFEPDTSYTPFSEWSRLAEALAEALREHKI